MKKTNPLLVTLKQFFKDHPDLESREGKVNRLLKEYAPKVLGKPLESFVILDLINERGCLNPDLEKFTDNFYSNLSSRGSQKSNLRKIAQAAAETIPKLNEEKAESENKNIVFDSLPEYLKPAVLALPRIGGDKIKKKSTSPERVILDLSEVGRTLLNALLFVHDQVKPNSIHELLIDHHYDISDFIKKNVKHEDRRGITGALCNLRKRCNVKFPKSSMLPIEKLPPKLRKQFENFQLHATKGLKSIPNIYALSKSYKVKHVDGLSPKTKRNYESFFLRGMAQIEFDGDIGIEDLLTLVPFTGDAGEEIVTNDAGGVLVRWHSPRIDQYRSKQRSKKTNKKDVGYDSYTFQNFITACTTIARFNGLFHLISPFLEIYSPCFDTENRRTSKDKKKKVMTREWLHNEIILLKKKFDEIIKEKSYRTNRDDLELCLYLPQLVTLRYKGFRQQCIRNCSIGRHIIFNRDGSISYNWDISEIKNEKKIETTISAEYHSQIPELMLLIDVSKKYEKHVLHYLRLKDEELFEERMGDSFFGYLDADGCLTQFGIDDEAKFTEKFETLSYKFLNFDCLKERDFEFNPHFLRAMCCDWMRRDLNMPWSDISDAMGDTEITLRREYYHDDKLSSATQPFKRVSDLRLAQQKVESDDSNGKLSKELIETISRLSKELERAINRADAAEEAGRIKDKTIEDLTRQLNQFRIKQNQVA